MVVATCSFMMFTAKPLDAQLGDMTFAELPDDVGTFSSKLPNSPEAKEAGKQIYMKRCMPLLPCESMAMATDRPQIP